MSSSRLQKEMKRLAKAQHMAGITPTVTVAAAAVPAPTNTPGASGHPPVARSNTPRPGSGSVASRPGVPTPSQNNNPQARGSTPVGIGTPRSVSTPGGTATAAANASANSPGVPGSTSAPAQLGAQAVAPITLASATPSGTTVNGPDVKRGIKREREDSVNGTGVRPMNGNSQPAEAKPYAGAKPGMNGIRPRPVKKQRVVSTLVMWLYTGPERLTYGVRRMVVPYLFSSRPHTRRCGKTSVQRDRIRLIWSPFLQYCMSVLSSLALNMTSLLKTRGRRSSRDLYQQSYEQAQRSFRYSNSGLGLRIKSKIALC